jgi:hypothetical protein
MGSYIIAYNRYRVLKKKQLNATMATMNRQQLKAYKKLNKVKVFRRRNGKKIRRNPLSSHWYIDFLCSKWSKILIK